MRLNPATAKLFLMLLCYGLTGLQGLAVAQVYKSYDAEGNVVFSDKPGQNSREVEISEPNVTDSFKVPPPAPSTAPAAPEPAEKPDPEPATQAESEVESADTNNDGRISRREKEKFREAQRKLKKAKAAAGSEN
jgi:hypothetical protein